MIILLKRVLFSLLLTTSVVVGMHDPAPKLDPEHEALLETIPAHIAEQVRMYVAEAQENFKGCAHVSIKVPPTQRQILFFVGIAGDSNPDAPTEPCLKLSSGGSFSWETDE